MTIPDLLDDEALRLREFPVARDKIFLAHAAVCPLPRRPAEAIRDYAAHCTAGDQETLGAGLRIPETRALAARLLSAQPEEIALVGPTSLGLSFVASGIPFRKNENILIYFDDYPSNVYPWMALAEKGVQVRFINTRELGLIRPIDIMGQVDEQTRLVALASAHFISGYRIDLDEIGRFLRQKNILFCVDAIQTLGAFPVSVENIDFLAADAHKWLLGPCGTGLFYVRKSLQELLRPAVYGWHNVRCPDYVAQEKIVFRRDARRYEAGTANLMGLAGLHAAMEFLLEIGVEAISQELLRKRSWLVSQLRAKGYNVLHGDVAEKNASGIVSFFREGMDLTGKGLALQAAGAVVSVRTDRAGRRYLRLSPHFYNTDGELERVMQLL